MITIKKEMFDQIVKHCQKEYPNEACGILAGKEGKVYGEHSRTVEKVYQMANTDKSPVAFFMDPKEQLEVMKKVRNFGLEIVGIYHSHLATEAYPSARDVELAFYPEASYVIVSIKDRNNPSIRSFRIVEGKIEEEKIIIRY